MSDDLRDLLRALPAHEPGSRFTGAVLARLERPAAAPRRALPAWAAAALAVALLAGAWGAVVVRSTAGERRKAELRDETAAIAAELRALREQAAQPAPLLYLGGTEEVDLVLDLSTLPVAAAVRVPGGARDPQAN